MRQSLLKLRALIGREPVVFIAALVIVVGVWGFIELLGEVREGDSRNFDERILRAFRNPTDTHRLIGPEWSQTAVRDVTALGGAVVLGLVVFGVAGFLAMTRRQHMMWVVLVAAFGAVAINATLKHFVARARPDVVPKLTDVNSQSFPSGHSAMSAAVYLTLGGLMAQTVSRRRVKLYFVGLALFLTLLVGLSRVALGVHYPTDVLAGWTIGLVWALLCWMTARYLQRRGAVEQEDDPDSSEATSVKR
jgi:undecaprenyl-diphosphatase